MNYRVVITLDEHRYKQLAGMAPDDPPGRTARRLLTQLLDHETGGPERTSPSQRSATIDRLSWIQPEDPTEAAGWRTAQTINISRLRDRYPVELARLPEGWIDDRHISEMLLALTAWRQELDAEADSKTELVFHAKLRELASVLPDRSGELRRASEVQRVPN